jgi:succinate dehydrogenase / fumarate reductase iron-sulfur subunit
VPEKSLHGKIIILEPLSKFPLVRDLIVDRSILFDNLKKLNLWLKSKAYMTEWTHEQRFQSARCLMCGCCLEVCPVGLPVEELIVRSNATAIWKK